MSSTQILTPLDYQPIEDQLKEINWALETHLPQATELQFLISSFKARNFDNKLDRKIKNKERRLSELMVYVDAANIAKKTLQEKGLITI